MTEHAIDATVMRGGTSKGVFVRAADLPPAGPERDRFILALMGSPDPMQINGLGGTHSSTSKLMAVSASDDPDCDVDYLFAQVAIDDAVVDYQGNCGNLTTAIAPFAIDEGLVEVCADSVGLGLDGSGRGVGPAGAGPGGQGSAAMGSARTMPGSGSTTAGSAVVVLRNLNTGVRVRAEVPLRSVEAGRAGPVAIGGCDGGDGGGGLVAVEGDLAVSGVPGTGPAITTDYLDPGGSVLGAVLPTGSPVDVIEIGDGTTIEASIVDVTSPHAFVRLADVDLGDLDRLEAIRSACGALVGLDSLAIPRLAIVGPDRVEGIGSGGGADAGGGGTAGTRAGDGPADLVGWATSMQRLHHAFPITGALCTAAAVRIPGTIPSEVARPTTGGAHDTDADDPDGGGGGGSDTDGSGPCVVRLRHPKGVVELRADVDGDSVRSVGVTRTARRLFRGQAFVVLP